MARSKNLRSQDYLYQQVKNGFNVRLKDKKDVKIILQGAKTTSLLEHQTQLQRKKSNEQAFQKYVKDQMKRRVTKLTTEQLPEVESESEIQNLDLNGPTEEKE